MKSLSTLIKISKSQIDEKRKALALLLDRKQGFIDKIRALEDSIKYEAENLEKTLPEFRPTYISYVFGCRTKEAVLLEEIDKLNPHINKLNDEIAQLFSEMKKYEIVKENREREIAYELNRKRQLEVDEMAIMNHIRKTDEELNANQ